MSEQYQKNFDLKEFYNLCEKIIKERDFKCLVELNEQCRLFYKELTDENNQNNSIEQSALFILLYYIYYLLLDKNERNIFLFLQKLIIYKNILIYKNYQYMIFDDNVIDEEKSCQKSALYILKQYSKLPIKTKEDINLEQINNFIYNLYIWDYEAINNDYYLLYILAIGDLNYSKVLSNLSYDLLMQRFNEIVFFIINKFNNNEFNDECDNTFDKSHYEAEIDELKF